MGTAPSLIVDNLWLGGADILNKEEWFLTNGITHTISVCPWRPKFSFIQSHIHIRTVADTVSSDLYRYFVQVVEFINNARTDGGVVYVHCAKGVSRSTTLVCAYLMTVLDIDYDACIRFVRHRRRFCRPNSSFQDQLRRWSSSADRLRLCEQFANAYDADRRVYMHYLQVERPAKLQALKEKRRRGKGMVAKVDGGGDDDDGGGEEDERQVFVESSIDR